MLTVADARQSRLEASCSPLFVLCLDSGFARLPLNAEWRIGYDIVEFVTFEFVICQRITLSHIVGVATFDERISFSNGKGLVVQLLTISRNVGIWINLRKSVFHTSQHLTGTHCHIVEGGSDAFFL